MANNDDEMAEARAFWAPRLAVPKMLETTAFDAISLGMSKEAWVNAAHAAFERAEFETEEAARISLADETEDVLSKN